MPIRFMQRYLPANVKLRRMLLLLPCLFLLATASLLTAEEFAERATLKGHTDVVNAVSFSSDSNVLASASSDGTVRLWSVSQGRIVHPFNTDTSQEQEFLVEGETPQYAVAFAPHGTMVGPSQWTTVAAARSDGMVTIWQLRDAAVIREEVALKGHNSVLCLTFSADGQTLAISDSRVDKKTKTPVFSKVKLWTISGATNLENFRRRVWDVTMDQQGELLATASDDGLIQLWDISGGAPAKLDQFRYTEPWSVAFSPDGKTLAAGSAFDVLLFDISGKRLVKLREIKSDFSNKVYCVAFSVDGKLLAFGHGKNVQIWKKNKQGKFEFRVGGNSHTNNVTAVEFSPDGKTLATASEDTSIKLWDLTLLTRLESSSKP